jgi:hypothetical protein
MMNTIRELFSRFTLSDALAVVGIVAGFVIYGLQRQSKRLGYRVFSTEPLLPFDLKRPGPRDHDIVVEVRNDGNVPLVAADFLSPIVVDFHNSKQITSSCLFLAAFADNLPVSVSHLGREGYIQPPLLNPRECVRVTFRVQGFEGDVRVRARIIGVNRVHNMALREAISLHLTLLSTVYLGFIVARLRDHDVIGQSLFWILAAPYMLFSVLRIASVVRQQFLGWMFRPDV